MGSSSASGPTSRGFQPGTRLGRYVVGERIGAGGMAEVYLAHVSGAAGFEKLFALKLIHGHMVDDPVHAKMLLKEARIAATLDHPNIVQVLDVGSHGGEHYLAMEYVHGADLRRIMLRQGRHTPMPLRYALPIVSDVATALHHAHTQTDASGQPLGIIHRDVSLSNVLVSYSGAVKLTDFGIAKMSSHTSTTAAGTMKGKFGYMSPEQSMAEPSDGRSDVFALGVVLYEITTGRRTFPGENAFSIMNKVLAGDYVNPSHHVEDYPPALEAIVQCALAVDVDDRFPTARAMHDALTEFALAAGIAMDHSALGDYVGSLFEWPALPDVEATDVPEPETVLLPGPSTEPVPVVVPIATGGSSSRWALGAVALVGALGIGAFAGSQLGSSDADEAAPPVGVAPLGAGVAAGVVRADDAAPVPTKDEAQPDAEESAEEGAAGGGAAAGRVDPSPRVRKSGRKRSGKNRSKKKKKKAPEAIDLRPPSMKGQPD